MDIQNMPTTTSTANLMASFPTMSSGVPGLSTIQATNWSGSIPVVLSLAPTSLSSPSMPSPIHVLVSRHSYLHAALQSAVWRLYKFAPMSLLMSGGGNSIMVRSEPEPGETSEERDGKDSNTKPDARITEASSSAASAEYPVCWFEDGDTQIALRWHLFAGILWDMKREENRNIPWKIRLHFTSYPSSQVLPMDAGAVMATVERTFKNSLKQALVLEYGNNKAALNMTKQSHERIWDSIVTSNYRLYQQVKDDLPKRSDVNALPVRVMVNARPPIQRICTLKDASVTTLGLLLLDWLPDMFQKAILEDDIETIQVAPKLPTTTCWRVQGIQVPLSTDLTQLWQCLSHPDHFLYVAIVMR